MQVLFWPTGEGNSWKHSSQINQVENRMITAQRETSLSQLYSYSEVAFIFLCLELWYTERSMDSISSFDFIIY